MNTFNLSLDLDKTPDVPDWVTLRQGDKSGTVIVATIYDHGTQLVGSYNARVVIGNPDGEHYYRANATYNAGVATVTVDEQTAASVAGTTVGYFEILQGSTVIASTASFGVRILPSALDGAEPGEVYDTAIQEAIDGLNEAVAELPDTVEGILEDHPEWTTTVQDGSITDAKLVQHGGILDRVERLTLGLGNLLTATPAEADSLTVTDAAKTPLAGLALYGRSTQDGTPTPSAPVAIESVQGNLLDISESTLTPRQTIDTTTGQPKPATAGDWLAPLVDVEAASVTFVVSDTGTYGGSFNMACYKASGEFISWMSLGRVTTTKELPSETGKVRVYGYYGSGYTHVLSVTAALYAGSQGTLPYVPYQNVGLWSRGRNLLPNNAVSSTVNGVTFTVNDDGSVTANGTASAYTELVVTRIAQFGSGVQYTLSGCPSGGSNSTYDLRCTVSGAVKQDTGAGISFVGDGGTGKFVQIVIRAGVTVSNITFRPMLSVGSTATPYQPYAESVTPIDLQGHALRSLPDGTRDELVVGADGHAVLVQRVGHVVLDGSENWMFNGGVGVGFAAAPLPNALNTSGINLMSDRFPAVFTTATGDSFYQSGTNALFFRGSQYSPSSAADAKSWAAAHPITVTYRLATPVTIDLGTIDPVALQGPDMTAQAVPTAPFALTYERDLNIIIGGIYAQLAPVDGPTATSNHGVGTYLMLGGTLCKVTTAIAAGETIAIGTNVVATNVMTEILALTA